MMPSPQSKLALRMTLSLTAALVSLRCDAQAPGADSGLVSSDAQSDGSDDDKSEQLDASSGQASSAGGGDGDGVSISDDVTPSKDADTSSTTDTDTPGETPSGTDSTDDGSGDDDTTDGGETPDGTGQDSTSGDDDSSTTTSTGSDDDDGSDDSGIPAACRRDDLDWRSGRKTWYESYPDPDSDECHVNNGCTWAGKFAACKEKKPEAWVMEHNIVAAYPDFRDLELHDLCLRHGDSYIVVTVYDTCSNSDCGDCCERNQKQTDQLIDLENYTNLRWGVEPEGNAIIEWADLGPTQGSGCN